MAVADFRQAGHKVAIPGAVKGAHALLNQRVRRVEREMGRSGQYDRTGAVVRRNRKMPGFGHGGDLLGFGDAAAPGEVQHDDAGRAGFQEIAECGPAAKRLRRADRGRDASA